MDARPRDRCGAARGDPAGRLPQPLPLERRRAERRDARARREEPHPQGTSGTIIAKKELFQVASLPKDDLKVGAISDPAYLNGRVAAGDIFPGQQITTADLSVDDHRGRPHQPDGCRARRRDPDRRRPAASSATRPRATTSTSTSVSRRGQTLLTLLAPDVEILRAPVQGQSTTYVLKAPRRSRRSSRSPRTPGRSGSSCARRSAPRRRRR